MTSFILVTESEDNYRNMYKILVYKIIKEGNKEYEMDKGLNFDITEYFDKDNERHIDCKL
jgi:hypothetical protein